MRKPRKSKREENAQLSAANADEDIVSSQVTGDDYPNEIARMHVSVPSKDVVQTSTSCMPIGNAMAKKLCTSSKASKADDSIESIWKLLGLGKIDLLQACVGYTHRGNPVLDHEDLVDLLLMYGFSTDVVLSFVDDFMECSSSTSDGTSPIVIYRKNTADIHANVVPIINPSK